MSITPITSQSSIWQTQQQNPWQAVLSSVSSSLGLSTSSLQQDLQSGQSLTQIAQSKGVSQSSLVQTITTALQQSGQFSGASSSQLQQMATNIASRTPGSQGHHHHHHGGGGADSSASQALLNALESTTSTGTDTGTSSDGSDGSSQSFDTLA